MESIPGDSTAIGYLVGERTVGVIRSTGKVFATEVYDRSYAEG